jgi:hypothetical protein
MKASAAVYSGMRMSGIVFTTLLGGNGMKRQSKRVLFLIIGALLCGVVSADEFHFINIFVGDRAAGMGGAYTAIADGPEGAYYNPAGLAFSSATYFSLSTNAIQYKRTSYNDIWAFSHTPDIDYVRTSFSFTPNFFGFIQKGKRGTFAFTMTSLDNETTDQRDKITVPNVIELADLTNLNVDQSLNVNFNYINSYNEIGISLAYLLHQRVSLGFSVLVGYGNRKTINQNVTQLYASSDDSQLEYFSITSSYFGEQIFSLRPQLGLQIMPTDWLSIGYLATFPVPIFGLYYTQSTSFTYAGSDINATYNFYDMVSVADNQQSNQILFRDGLFETSFLKQSLGLAFFVSRSLIISLDGYLYIPFPFDPDDIYAKRITLNGALGVEWYITPNFPLRAGVFTNRANTAKIESEFDEGLGVNLTETVNQKDHVNMYGGTLSIGFATADSGINLGVSVAYGRGDAQILKNFTIAQEAELLAISVFISGGYQF